MHVPAEESAAQGVSVPVHPGPGSANQEQPFWAAQDAGEVRNEHMVSIPVHAPAHMQPNCPTQPGSEENELQGSTMPTQVASVDHPQPVVALHVATSVYALHVTTGALQVPPAPPSSGTHVQPVDDSHATWLSWLGLL
jgi:hypothetical protein